MLTQEYVNSLFEYHAGTGILYWKKTGTRAGWTSKEGYRKVGIGKKAYFVHRIIWLMHTGYMPYLIDHINRDKSDNRIENLRDVSYNENLMNQGVRKNNKLGMKNISWHRASNRWRVAVCRDYKNIELGYFKCLGEAIKCRQQFQEA